MPEPPRVEHLTELHSTTSIRVTFCGSVGDSLALPQKATLVEQIAVPHSKDRLPSLPSNISPPGRNSQAFSETLLMTKIFYKFKLLLLNDAPAMDNFS